MKSTDTILIEFEKEENPEYHQFSMSFFLHDEDLNMALEIIQGLKEVPEMPETDLADFLLGCITHEIHVMYEEITGKKFTFRMDRGNRA